MSAPVNHHVSIVPCRRIQHTEVDTYLEEEEDEDKQLKLSANCNPINVAGIMSSTTVKLCHQVHGRLCLHLPGLSWLSKLIPKCGILAKRSIAKTTVLGKSNRHLISCLLYTSPSPRDRQKSRMPSSA